MRTHVCSCASALFLTLCALPAFAQMNVSIAGYDIRAQRQERLGENHGLLIGEVEIERGDTKLYAEKAEIFEDQDRVIASGNVVLSQGNNRIAADRADFNTKTRLGTFYHASGIANVQPQRRQPSQSGGINVPQMTGQETDVYFFGEKIEKVGFKKYKITNGGFSTCVQPTPRWHLSAETVVLNLDHYTLLRQAIFKVKGVPMLYVPVLYYPTKEDGRATGFLIPTYGSSTIRGQTIHSAFFWAIDRSHDATLLYDWYSKTGSGGGSEYRYNLGEGSDGVFSTYVLNEHTANYVQSNGSVTTKPGTRSYFVNGSAHQQLPGGLRARARVDYFSSIVSNQTFHTDIYTAASNTRNYGGNVVGAWGSYSLNGTFDRNEWFTSTTTSAVMGSSPRISLSRNERPLFANAPVYFAVSGEFAHLDRQTSSGDAVIDDRSLGRVDFSPQIRYPFKRWQWFTVNTSLNWRKTYYTRSLDPETREPVDVSLNRQYTTMLAQVVGPSFTRVWNTPDNRYAERFKHSIEPFFNVQRTTKVARRSEIVQIDGVDTPYGDTTSLSYGINNRVYAKRRIGQNSQAQEILNIEISQSYYTDARQSLVDPGYSTSFTGTAPNKFSPVRLQARTSPTQNINGTVRAEIDSRYRQLRTLSVSTSHDWERYLQTSVGWSRNFFIRNLPGFNNPSSLTHYLNFATNARTRDNKYGAAYSFNYDVQTSTMTQGRMSAFYNAQCCGIAFEYQRYAFAGLPSFVVPADHRFFLSFTLAGLGNFSPFNGGMNGVPR